MMILILITMEAEKGQSENRKIIVKSEKKTVLNATKLLGVRKYFSKPENLFQPDIYFLVHKSFFKSKKISQIRNLLPNLEKFFEIGKKIYLASARYIYHKCIIRRVNWCIAQFNNPT